MIKSALNVYRDAARAVMTGEGSFAGAVDAYSMLREYWVDASMQDRKALGPWDALLAREGCPTLTVLKASITNA